VKGKRDPVKKGLLVFGLLGGLVIPLAAQKPPAPGAGSGLETAAPTQGQQNKTSPFRIKVPVNLVNVLFTVTDKKHRLVLDLNQSDLRVFEDKKPQTIRFFSRETDLPLRIGILIDTSNSIRERLRFEQEAAIDFLDATLRPDTDQAFVVGFDVTPQLVQDYTDDTNKLADAIRGLQAGGGTGLYDAIYYACKEKMLYFPPPQPYLRRVMIVVSDGEDNQSQHTLNEALAMAERGEVTLFAISTNRTGIATRGDRVLDSLADQTGGRAFRPFSAGDVAEDFQQISKELRSQYSLAYVSTNPAHDGTFRNITLEPRDKNYHIRAKAGYFAPGP
jgi:VWFA-related protein